MKKTNSTRFRNLLISTAILSAPVLTLAFSHCNPTGAQERRPSYRQQEYRSRQGNQPQENFKSGGERSEIILKEILTTLKTIDQRLEKLEKVAEAHDALGARSSNSRGR